MVIFTSVVLGKHFQAANAILYVTANKGLPNYWQKNMKLNCMHVSSVKYNRNSVDCVSSKFYVNEKSW